MLAAELGFFVTQGILPIKIVSDTFVEVVLSSDVVELELGRDSLADHVTQLIGVVEARALRAVV